MWHRGRCGAPWARLWCLCKSSRAADEARSSIGSAHPKGSIHSSHGRPDLCSVSSYCPVSWKRSEDRRNCVPAPSARKFGNIAADPISMSGGPASRSRGAPLILMLKRLQHLGSLRLVVRSLASCCALLGGLCGARWLLACSDAVGKIRPSRCSYGSQGIVEPYSIPEQSSARKGENSTSSCWLFRSFIPWNCKFVGNDSKPTSLPPRINLPCCRGSRISSTLRSPVPLLIPCEFLPLWFLTIGDASLLRLIRKHVRLRRNKTRGRDNRWRVRDCRLAKKRIPRGTQACQEKNEQAEVRNEASDSQTT